MKPYSIVTSLFLACIFKLYTISAMPDFLAQVSRRQRAVQKGQWGSWTQWSECADACGGSQQTRSRRCVSTTACRGPTTETRACECAPAAKWSQWGEWGQCQATCGQAGVQTRTRTCSQGKDCPGSATDTQSCNTYVPCAQWSQWTPYSKCSVTCQGGADKGTQTRTRTCSQTGGCLGPDKETAPCGSYIPCSKWTEWSAWSSCQMTCGGTSVMARTRECKPTSKNPGDCPGQPKESQPCPTAPPCAMWTQWSPYSKCSTTCGSGGTQTRTRQCSGLGDCKGDSSETTPCQSSSPCATWADWGTWTTCSATCGNGQITRTRTCSVQGQCPGNDKETKDCKGCACPAYQQWQEWGICSLPCGGGQQQRCRDCTTDSQCCSSPDSQSKPVCQCTSLGPAAENRTCNTMACATWSDWQAWSECSVSCGKGQQTRKRECNADKTTCGDTKMANSPACKCKDDTSSSATQPCDKGECYTWSSWSHWSECTVLCGGGSRNRSRQCPVPDGCPGLVDSTDICNMMPCPDWGDWSPWSDCTVTCGGGQRARTRSCPMPKACSPGEDYEADTTCGVGDCPTWTDWAEWQPCSKTCGQGNRQRTRTCSIADGCLGSPNNIEPCFTKACSLSTEWSQWSPCTATCGGGTQTRNRVKCPKGPPSCPVESESTKCQEQACPLWSDWGEWGECSKTCGGGQRTRSRTCPVVNGCLGQNTDIDGTPCNAFGCSGA